MSYKGEIQVGNDPKWYSNGLRFATADEAELYAKDLLGRWTTVRFMQVSPSDDPVTHHWNGDKAVTIEA